MRVDPDYLYQLLPPIYRERDAAQGYPLRALLQVITEQVDIVKGNLDDTYDNWFIETCADWVVPYLGDLIGYQAVHAGGDPFGPEPRADEGAKILVPRREVANTLRYRRRKGTLPVLGELARAVTGWPVLAVEFAQHLGLTQPIESPRMDLGKLVDLRDRAALALLDSPFDTIAHRPDLRGGRGPNLPDVGVFVWRLKVYPVGPMPAHSIDDARWTFSVLGHDTQLYTAPAPDGPGAAATEAAMPGPIRRPAFAERDAAGNPGHASTAYYGVERSVMIWSDHLNKRRHTEPKPIDAAMILPADLHDWAYVPPRGRVAVDPVLGRIAFPVDQPARHVRVFYHHGFPADLGGGEYERALPDRPDAVRVKTQAEFEEALRRWGVEKPPDQVIEIAARGVYELTDELEIFPGQRLTLRAADGICPVLQPDCRSNERRRMTIGVAEPEEATAAQAQEDKQADLSCRVVLDGLLIAGRGLQIEGDFAEIVLRHCTLVPGWSGSADRHAPARETKGRAARNPSLELAAPGARVTIDHCILGAIEVVHGAGPHEPSAILLTDSIIDALNETAPALFGEECRPAHARLTVMRSTIRGSVFVHAIDLAENSIFDGCVTVARTQQGCIRFCYLRPDDRQRTPPRYQCQPDLVAAQAPADNQAILRVQPQFDSMQYGDPAYFRLSVQCAQEIRSGADDESEMGVYHDLLEPQKLANLRTRLDQFTPAALQAAIILES